MKRLLFALLLFMVALSHRGLSTDKYLDYPNYLRFTSELKNLQAAYPDLIHLESLSTTIEQRQVWVLALGAQSSESKPALLFVGGVEAPDIASGAILFQFVKQCASAYGKVDSVTYLLDHFSFYIVPRLSPDAAEQLWSSLKYERFLNAHSMDLDSDGDFDEDGYDDLNGDGLISHMRVADAQGRWMIDPVDPFLMRLADPAKNETGEFKILSEGFDNDKDGELNEDELGGVNGNQNFPYNYKFFQYGAGMYPISEIETKALADFMFAHENIAAVFSFSEAANLIEPWPALKADENKPVSNVLLDDEPYYAFFAEKYKQLVAHDGLSQSPRPGNFGEWAYYHFGRWSFTLPVWTPPTLANTDSLGIEKDDPIEYQRRLLRWLRAADRENELVPWQKIEHIDFPDQRVEIGGFIPGIQMNPPADSIAALSKKIGSFFLHFAEFLPELKLQTSTTALDKNIYRITAVIKNDGYLPTNSRLGDKSKWVRKVKTEIQLAGDQQLLSGKQFYLSDRLAGGEAVEFSWLVFAKRGQELKIQSASPSSGSVEKIIELK